MQFKGSMSPPKYEHHTTFLLGNTTGTIHHRVHRDGEGWTYGLLCGIHILWYHESTLTRLTKC